MKASVSRTGKQGRLLKMALGIGIVVMLVKFTAFFITNSTAILTDALESIVNLITGGFALYSLYVAAKPKDLDHPYGHGKIEFFSAGIEGALIFFAGIFILIRAVFMLVFPDEIVQIDTGILLTAISGAIIFITGAMLVREGRNSNSIILEANGKHLISDTISSLILVIGLVIIYFTGILWLDNVLAIALGGFIISTGYKLLRKSIAGLMDEADMKLLEKLVSVLEENRKDRWIDIHNLRVVKYGNNLHIDCHMTLPWYDNLQLVHEEVNLVEDLVNKELGSRAELSIHADPCEPQQCPICTIKDCPVRRYDFQKELPWTVENVLNNKRHNLQDVDL